MKKTALQSAIEAIQDILNSRGANESNCDDFEFGLIESVKILKSKLPQEKQDLIDAYQCGADEYFDADMYHKTGTDYFKEEFEI